MKTTKQILLDAAEILKTRGRTTGRYIDQDGKVCLIGALRIATYGHPHMSYTTPEWREFAKARAALAAVVGEPVPFNDDPLTTTEMVLSALAAAAERQL